MQIQTGWEEKLSECILKEDTIIYASDVAYGPTKGACPGFKSRVTSQYMNFYLIQILHMVPS